MFQGHMGNLVGKHRGEFILALHLAEQSSRYKDMSARRGERVDLLAVENMK